MWWTSSSTTTTPHPEKASESPPPTETRKHRRSRNNSRAQGQLHHGSNHHLPPSGPLPTASPSTAAAALCVPPEPSAMNNTNGQSPLPLHWPPRRLPTPSAPTTPCRRRPPPAVDVESPRAAPRSPHPHLFEREKVPSNHHLVDSRHDSQFDDSQGKRRDSRHRPLQRLSPPSSTLAHGSPHPHHHEFSPKRLHQGLGASVVATRRRAIRTAPLWFFRSLPRALRFRESACVILCLMGLVGTLVMHVLLSIISHGDPTVWSGSITTDRALASSWYTAMLHYRADHSDHSMRSYGFRISFASTAVTARSRPTVVSTPMRSVVLPSRGHALTRGITMGPDYNELRMDSLRMHDSAEWIRNVAADEQDHYETFVKNALEEMDHADPNRNDYGDAYESPSDLTYPRACYHPVAAWKNFPTCNTFHENASFDAIMFPTMHHRNKDESTHDHNDERDHDEVRYLGHGYFRDTWLIAAAAGGTFPHGAPENDGSFVLKTLKALDEEHDHPFNNYLMKQISKEALAMEDLTSSPRIVDIYGHCATSIIAEPMPGDITTQIVPGDKEDYYRGRMSQNELDKHQQEDVFPLNNFTVMEKVTMALLMAESLADLHGMKGGVFVHGDAHPDQWLVARNGALKLNDFNNGVFLDFNPQKMKYCKFWTSYGGAYKAPEEFRGDYCDEGVDTWALGHGIYGLLTGLYPFYRTRSQSKVRKMVIDGKLPFIDNRYRTRSYIEGRMVEIMEKCWAYQSEDRASVFDVVQHLRETIRESKHH